MTSRPTSTGPRHASGPTIVESAPPLSLREIFTRFWPYARPYRWFIWLTLPFIVLAPAIETARIWLFKVVVDEVLVPRDFGPFWWIALSYIGLSLSAGVIGYGDRYLASWVGGKFILSLRTRLFSHLQGLSLDFFERRPLGDMISRLTSDVAAIESFVLSGIGDALAYILRIVYFAGALLYIQWELDLVSLIVAPLFWFVPQHFARVIRRASRERRRRSGSISSVAEESFSNAALVQAYNRQDAETDRFERENLGNFEAHMMSTRARALLSPLVSLVGVISGLMVIGAGVWMLSEGRLSMGELLVFLTYLGGLYSPIRGLGHLSTTIYAASAAAERIAEFQDEKPSVYDRPDALSLQHARGLIEFENVSFHYPHATRDALTGVTFRVEPGETLALVGPSGAGKSTIFKLLLRFYDPTAGAIRLDGHDLRDLRVRALREHTQENVYEPSNPFSLTAGTSHVLSSTTRSISPFDETRALKMSYAPAMGTARPCTVTSVGKGWLSPRCSTSLTRIGPMSQKSACPSPLPPSALTLTLGRSALTSCPCKTFASSILAMSRNSWDCDVTRASIGPSTKIRRSLSHFR